MALLSNADAATPVLFYASLITVALGLVIYRFLPKEAKIPKGLRALPTPPGARFLSGHAHIYTGNTTNNPSESQLVKWAQEHGEVYQIYMGTQRWVVVSSPEAIKDIFDRNGTLTGSRARARVAMDVLSGGLRMFFMPYGKKWRDVRSLVHRCLSAKSADKMKPLQDVESRRYLHDLLVDPVNFLTHVKRYSASVIMYVTYGRRIESLDDPVLDEIYRETTFFGEVFGTQFAVDQYPILEKLPKALHWWRYKYEPYHQKELNLWLGLWNDLKEQLAQGVRTGCFSENLMEVDYPKLGISEAQAAYIAGAMIEAGSDTTQLTLNSLILGLVAFPETVMKAHKELDEVVGDRLPTFDDWSRLPYIRAMVKEVLRWRTASNDHIHHYSTGDVVYKDYFIPAGSFMILNVWGVHFDPNLFHDPQRFDPDRYMGTAANDMTAGECISASDTRQRDHWGFGAGRRVCAGYNVAENSLFILAARLLWAFDVKAPIDKSTGKPLTYDIWNFRPTQMYGPNPFAAEFTIRDEQRSEAIVQGVKVAAP